MKESKNFKKRVENWKSFLITYWIEDEMRTALNTIKDSNLALKLEKENSKLIIPLYDGACEEALNEILGI